ncbi:hypothetical protein, partial [Kocuria salsicia]|uniref:hypothetical protein n=1 Tax=Kocuria salsicia TaxID=664639 RepID=UPI001C92ECF2
GGGEEGEGVGAGRDGKLVMMGRREMGGVEGLEGGVKGGKGVGEGGKEVEEVGGFEGRGGGVWWEEWGVGV